MVQQIGATYLFVVDGDDPGVWMLDLKNGVGSSGAADADAKTDVTFKMNSVDLVAMFKGKLNATTAFMMGKMKITGDIGKAMKLDKLMGKMQSKL